MVENAGAFLMSGSVVGVLPTPVSSLQFSSVPGSVAETPGSNTTAKLPFASLWLP